MLVATERDSTDRRSVHGDTTKSRSVRCGGVNECDSFAGAHVPLDASQSTDLMASPWVYSFSTPLDK